MCLNLSLNIRVRDLLLNYTIVLGIIFALKAEDQVKILTVCVCFCFVLLFYRYYFFTSFSRYVILPRLCTSDEWSCSLSFKSSSICLLCWFIVFSNSSRVFAKLSPIKIQHHN